MDQAYISTSQEATEHQFLVDLSKHFFSKHQNKVLKLLNSRIWKTLKSSVVIFQALETSSA